MTTTWKCQILQFMEDVNKQRRNFISLFELGYGPLKFSFWRVRLHLTKQVRRNNSYKDWRNAHSLFKRRSRCRSHHSSHTLAVEIFWWCSWSTLSATVMLGFTSLLLIFGGSKYMRSSDTYTYQSEINLIKLLPVQFTSEVIVLKSENNSYT